MKRLWVIGVLAALSCSESQAPPNTGTHQITIAVDGPGRVTGASIDCRDQCVVERFHAQALELSVEPSAGAVFLGWSGPCSGAGTCTFEARNDTTVTASFGDATATLTVIVEGGGAVELRGRTTCGASCATDVALGEMVVLQAVAPAGGTFDGWSGACSGGVTECVLMVDAPAFVVARFSGGTVVDAHSVTVTTQGAGSIVSQPPGISCPGICTAAFAAGTELLLTAAPEPEAWSGACNDVVGGRCMLTVNADLDVGATFPATFNLKVDLLGTGLGTVQSVTPPDFVCSPGDDCTADFAPGTMITLEAIADANTSTFDAFTGCDTQEENTRCQITMNADRQVSATFDAATMMTNLLTVTKNGTGTGVVTSRDGAINCGTDCSAGYVPGAMVTLDAQGDPGSYLAQWVGCPGVAPDGSCTVDPANTSMVTATFDVGSTLTVSVVGDGVGTVTSAPPGISCSTGQTCSEVYPFGSMIELATAPGPTSAFWGWAGDCNSRDLCTIDLMEAVHSVTAEFGPACNDWSVDLAGAGDMVEVNGPQLDVSSEMTIDAWIEPVPSPGAPAIIASRQGAECAFSFTLSPNGVLSLCVFSACGESLCSETGLLTLNAGRFYHLAATFGSVAGVSFFVDGVQVPTEVTNDLGFTGTIAAVTEPLRVGSTVVSPNGPMRIASLRLSGVNRFAGSAFNPVPAPPPSPADIFNWHFSDPSSTIIEDVSPNGLDGTLSGGSWINRGPGCP